MTYWKDLKGRCLAAGGLKKGQILEGIGARAAPKAGDLKKRSCNGRCRNAGGLKKEAHFGIWAVTWS